MKKRNDSITSKICRLPKRNTKEKKIQNILDCFSFKANTGIFYTFG